MPIPTRRRLVDVVTPLLDPFALLHAIFVRLPGKLPGVGVSDASVSERVILKGEETYKAGMRRKVGV
jgi:hypothetical protein